MGKHFWWGCGLLAVLLAGTLTVSVAMDRCQRATLAELEQAQQTTGRERLRCLNRARQHWQRCSGAISAISDHTPMDEIDGLFAEAELFGQAGEHTHFSTTCARLCQLLQAMADDQKLTLRNLL